MDRSTVLQKIEQARAQGAAADLSGIDLRVERFENVDFGTLNFSDANLSGSEFQACNLTGCNFHRANLQACKLIACDLSGAELSEATLAGARLADCRLLATNLYGADLRGSSLDGGDWTGAVLTRAMFDSASWSGTVLPRAQLAGASLREAALDACDLSEADLQGAILYGAKLRRCKLVKSTLNRADLRDSNLGASDLSGADLGHANLENANLSGAVLIAADLQGANLINADLTLADLSGADLRNADLMDAHVRDGRQPVLQGAMYDDGTEWPEGLDWSQATRSLARRAPRPSAAPQGGVARVVAGVATLFTRDRPPRYTLPDRHVEAEERAIANRGADLLLQLYEALRHNRRVPKEKKTAIKAQARRTLDNVVALLWNLARIRGGKAVVGPEGQAEIAQLEARLLAELKRSSQVLEAVLVSTLQLEVKAGDRTVDRLLAELDESNQRMRALAAAYEEVRGTRF
jgi:uncharacterized protein YjbI with pentapeptide repeats